MLLQRQLTNESLSIINKLNRQTEENREQQVINILLAYRNKNSLVPTDKYLGKKIGHGVLKDAHEIDEHMVALVKTKQENPISYNDIENSEYRDSVSEDERYFDLITKDLAFDNRTLAKHIIDLYAKNIFYDKKIILTEKGIILHDWLRYPTDPDGRKLNLYREQDQQFYYHTILNVIEFIEYAYYLYSQTNYIHPDVKPSNIILKADSNGWLPKMIDKQDIRVNNDFSSFKSIIQSKAYVNKSTYSIMERTNHPIIADLIKIRMAFESSKNTVIKIVSLTKITYHLIETDMIFENINSILCPLIKEEQKKYQLIKETEHFKNDIYNLAKYYYDDKLSVNIINQKIGDIEKIINYFLQYLKNFFPQPHNENKSDIETLTIIKKIKIKLETLRNKNNVFHKRIVNKKDKLVKQINRDCDQIISINEEYFSPSSLTWKEFQKKRHSNWKKIENNEFINQFRKKDKIGQALAKINDILSIIQKQKMDENQIQDIKNILKKFIIKIKYYLNYHPSPLIEEKITQLTGKLKKDISDFLDNNKLKFEDKITHILQSMGELGHHENSLETIKENKYLELKEEKNQCSNLLDLADDTQKPFYQDLLRILINIECLTTMANVRRKSSTRIDLGYNKKHSWIPTTLNLFKDIILFRANYKKNKDIVKKELLLIKDILNQLFYDYKSIRDKIDNLINNDLPLKKVEHKIKTIYQLTYFIIENQEKPNHRCKLNNHFRDLTYQVNVIKNKIDDENKSNDDHLPNHKIADDINLLGKITLLIIKIIHFKNRYKESQHYEVYKKTIKKYLKETIRNYYNLVNRKYKTNTMNRTYQTIINTTSQLIKNYNSKDLNPKTIKNYHKKLTGLLMKNRKNAHFNHSNNQFKQLTKSPPKFLESSYLYGVTPPLIGF